MCPKVFLISKLKHERSEKLSSTSKTSKLSNFNVDNLTNEDAKCETVFHNKRKAERKCSQKAGCQFEIGSHFTPTELKDCRKLKEIP